MPNLSLLLSLRMAAVLPAMSCVSQNTSTVCPRHSFVFDGGLIDESTETTFLINNRRHLEAVELRTGRTRWIRNQDLKPIAVVAKNLIALGSSSRPNELVVQFPALATGKSTTEAKHIVLDSWVDVNGAQGKDFEYDVSVVGQKVRLTWHARSWYAGGAPAPPQVQKRYEREAAGEVLIDPHSSVAESRPLPVSASDRTEVQTELANKRSSPYWRASRLRSESILLDDQLVTFERTNSAGQVGVLLRCWSVDESQPAPPVRLTQGQVSALRLTYDGRHVMVEHPVAKSSPATLVWTIFALPKGERVGKLSVETGSEPLVVSGDMLFYTVTSPSPSAGKPTELKRQFKAVGLVDNKLVWTRRLESRRVASTRRLPP